MKTEDTLSPHMVKFYKGTLRSFCSSPSESDCVEFKKNFANLEDIAKYISALANSDAREKQPKAYLIWGIEDKTHEIIGTTFNPATEKKGNQPFESWLSNQLSPSTTFDFIELLFEEKRVVILEISPAVGSPLLFNGLAYVRIGTTVTSLKKHPSVEKEIWDSLKTTCFEEQVACQHVSEQELKTLLHIEDYFKLLNETIPDNNATALEYLEKDRLIKKITDDTFVIYNLGALLLAKNLSDFQHLENRRLRVVFYKGISKINTVREIEGKTGYASGINNVISFLDKNLPSSEIIEHALRKSVPVYPVLALRELIVNALIHQDFNMSGTHPMIEIFDDRIEITNTGAPLYPEDRLLDMPPRSRNEKLVRMARRFGICEERGSGIDKVIHQVELMQLPAPLFEAPNREYTRVVLFSYKPYSALSKEDKLRACYYHCVLLYAHRKTMTNTSLRQRFRLEDNQASQISKLIKEALTKDLIAEKDESVGNRSKQYVPYWAVKR